MKVLLMVILNEGTYKILKGVSSPKLRSKTFPGIAAAFADQWTGVPFPLSSQLL